MKIDRLDNSKLLNPIKNDLLNALEDIIDSGELTMGNPVNDLEN